MGTEDSAASASQETEQPIDRIQRVRRGQGITAIQQNKIIDAVNTPLIGIRSPIQLVGAANPVVSQEAQFSVVEQKGDFLICREFDGIQEGQGEIKVANPPLLRRSLFEKTASNTPSRDGSFFTYDTDSLRCRVSETDPSDIQAEEIHPQYLPGDIIFATRNILRGTGVSVQIEGNEAREIVEWQDENKDGRHWHRLSALGQSFLWDKDNLGTFVVQKKFIEQGPPATVGAIARLGNVASGGTSDCTKQLGGLIPNAKYMITARIITDESNNAPNNFIRVIIGDIDVTVNQTQGLALEVNTVGFVTADGSGNILVTCEGSDGAGGSGSATDHVFLISIRGEA